MKPHAPAHDELPRPVQRRTLSYWVCLLLVVGPVYSIVPFSWAFVLYSLTSPDGLFCFAWPGRCLFACCLAEVAFSVYHYRLYTSIAGTPAPTPVDIHLLRKCLSRVLEAGLTQVVAAPDDKTAAAPDPMAIFEPLRFDDPRAVDFRDRLRTWFRGIPWGAIHLHEMHTWLYWATFGAHFTSLDDIPEGHRVALQDALQLLQYRTGCTLPEGSNPEGRPYLLKLDPINVYGRPFVYYALIALGNHLLRRHCVSKYGAQIGNHAGLDYLLRIPPTESSLQPIVFLHGLGVGFLQYQDIIGRLLHAHPDRPVLVLRQPSISQEIFHPAHLQPMGQREMVDAMHGLLDKLGWTARGVTVLSHSNGSIPHAWLVKECPRIVKRSCFVDPVVFCTWEGDVCHNFVYRKPHNGLGLLMRYFVGTELGIANTIQRHFNWAENTLWIEEIPDARNPTSAKFHLGGHDSIVASARVRQYLLAHGAHDGDGVVWNPTGMHGEAILTNCAQLNDIFNWLGVEME